MELRDLGGALWRQKLLVLVVLVITAGAVGVGVLVAPKTYVATAVIDAQAGPDAASGPDDVDDLRAALAGLVGSRAVLDDARAAVPAARDDTDLARRVEGRWVRGTDRIELTVRDADPRVAADLANAIVAALPRQESSAALELTVRRSAVAPATFADPDLRLAIGVGTALALLLAAGAALLRDRRTTTVDDGASAESATSSPLLAHLAPPRDPTLLPALHPGTAAADVFARLRVALDSEARRHPVHRLVVAGVTTGEVNVWLGANLAVALAAQGRRVLLVDGRLGDRFGARPDEEPDTSGLYDVLAGGSLERAISPGPAPGLMVLPSGAWGISAPEMLLENRFAEVMDEVQARFDLVVVLAPALDLSDDARLMAAGASLLLAVPEGGVTAAALRAHTDRVRSVGARLLGVVLVGRHLEPAPV